MKFHSPESPTMSPTVDGIPRSKSGMSFPGPGSPTNEATVENGLGNSHAKDSDDGNICALVIQGKSLV